MKHPFSNQWLILLNWELRLCGYHYFELLSQFINQLSDPHQHFWNCHHPNDVHALSYLSLTSCQRSSPVWNFNFPFRNFHYLNHYFTIMGFLWSKIFHSQVFSKWCCNWSDQHHVKWSHSWSGVHHLTLCRKVESCCLIDLLSHND